LAFAALAAALVMGVAASVRAVEAPKPCCFTNERYSGVCRVVPANNESCEGILAYLNDPTSAGRTYCDSTNIRGGWIQVSCGTGKPTEGPPAARVGRRAHGSEQPRSNQR